MRIGLIGLGRTGRAVATVLLESPQHSVEWVLRRSDRLAHRSLTEFLGLEGQDRGTIYSIAEYTAGALLDQHPVDVIVDFSSADGVYYYGAAAAQRGISILSAVSHYPAQTLAFLEELSAQTKVIYSPNITLGVNFLLLASKVLRGIVPQVDVEVVEEHFKGKREVSGTAKVLASAVGVEHEQIKTIRAGGIVGTHEIIFGFPYQTVRMRHESIAREAFGNGVLFALNQLPAADTGFYAMQDLLLPFFNLAHLDHVVQQRACQ